MRLPLGWSGERGRSGCFAWRMQEFVGVLEDRR